MRKRIGIIGPGGIADRFLAPALRRVPGAELWSVASRSLDRARAFATKHGAAAPEPAYDDVAAMLADPALDAVIISTPDRLHAAQAIAAAKAHKHVFVEKPMSASVDEAREMVAACRAADVRLGVAYHLRFHAGHKMLANQVHHGALGELRHMRAQWTYRATSAENWRASNEVGRWWALAGVGTHLLDMIRWMMVPSCGEIIQLTSLTAREIWKRPHEETAVVAMRFASGATAELVASVLFDSTPSVEIFGTAASATCEGTLGPHGRGRIRARGAEIQFPFDDPYQGEILDFVTAIQNGRSPEVDGTEGLRNVELLCEASP